MFGVGIEEAQPLGVDAFDQALLQRMIGQHAKAGLMQVAAKVLRGVGVGVVDDGQLHVTLLNFNNYFNQSPIITSSNTWLHAGALTCMHTCVSGMVGPQPACG